MFARSKETALVITSRRVKLTSDEFRQSLTRDRAASRTHARPRWAVVGFQGRLEAGARVRAAGRRHRGFVRLLFQVIE